MDILNLVGMIIKMGALLALFVGLIWILGRKKLWQKVLGAFAVFLIVQIAISLTFGDFKILSDFDQGLLILSCTMAMVALGLNLIYGFNGQFSLAQWGFYGLGAYCAADITFRWVNGDPRGLFVVGFGVVLAGLAMLGVSRLLRRKRGIPVLSAFTFYLLAVAASVAVAYFAGSAVAEALKPLMGSAEAPGILRSPATQQIVFVLSVLFAGAFAAEISYLFGLPVLTLGSDYFGIATLGFAIVVNTLMINSDTILPFPEMKGGRGMGGIQTYTLWLGDPRFTSWFWAFVFLVLIIIVMRNFVHSSNGRAVMAVREDETAARAMGIDVAGTKLLAFVIGSLFAGIGGAVYAHYIGFLSPQTFDFLSGFNPLIIVVFGGLGSMTGTITASFTWIFFLEGFLRVLLGQLGTEAPTWRFVLYPIALLLLMLVRPQGLLGTVEWGFLKAKKISSRIRPGTGMTPPDAAGGAK